MYQIKYDSAIILLARKFLPNNIDKNKINSKEIILKVKIIKIVVLFDGQKI